jgi:hypothetical protein
MNALLESPVRARDWQHEASRLNGNGRAGDSKLGSAKLVEDAGPWEPIVQTIVAMQNLSDDWDGMGAKAPTREVLESAIGLAYLYAEQAVDPPHRVVPGLDGTVIMEWQEPDGTHTEVEIDRPLHAEVMLIEPGQPAKHWTLPTQ